MGKPTYAPVPARAMCDSRLSERHLRTLMVVAAHDRLGKNGIGCWASQDRLAKMVGCAYTRLSMNLRELGEYGYLEQVEHPLNKRLRVYRVIYTDEDAATMRAVKQQVRESFPNGEVFQPDSSPNGEPGTPDSSPTPTESANDFKGDSTVNIFPEGGNTSCETVEIHSPEGASSGDDAMAIQHESRDRDEIGVALGKLQSAIKSGAVREWDLNVWENWLAGIAEDPDAEHWGWAGRLLEEVEALQEDAA